MQYVFEIKLTGEGQTLQEAFQHATEDFSKNPLSYLRLVRWVSSLYYFAEENFGISWNEADRLFRSTVLGDLYRSIVELDLSTVRGWVEEEPGDAVQYFTDLQVDKEAMEKRELACAIIGKWMLSLGVRQVFLDDR